MSKFWYNKSTAQFRTIKNKKIAMSKVIGTVWDFISYCEIVLNLLYWLKPCVYSVFFYEQLAAYESGGVIVILI